MLLRYSCLLLSLNLIGQNGSIENARPFFNERPDLLTQVTRIQEARAQAVAHMHIRPAMIEDNNDTHTLRPEAILSCLCCTAAVGGYALDSLMPTLACDSVRFGLKIGAAASIAPTLWVLNKPSVNRTINDAYKALINKLD